MTNAARRAETTTTARLGPGRVPYSLCRAAFPSGDTGRQQYHRFFDRLAQTLRETAADGERYIDGAVTLPNGVRAGEHVQDSFPFRPPAGWRQYAEAQRLRWRLMVEREMRFQRFVKANPHLQRSNAATYRAFAKDQAAWLAEAGAQLGQRKPLAAAKSTMLKARADLIAGREIPQRGRPKGAGKKDWHPRALELFEQLYFTAHKREASDVLETIVAFAWKEGFVTPTPQMVRRKIAETPHAVMVRARKGAKAFAESCVPKGKRGRQAVRDWASCDARVQDAFARVPDAGGGWRPVRLVASGIYLPFAKAFSALRFGVTENHELIAATVRDSVLRDGVQRIYHTDNGKAYDALTGSPRKSATMRDRFERGGIGGFFDIFGAQVLKSDPYAGWQKAIESAWNFMKRSLDRWVDSFCGGWPAEKPEKLDRWLRANADKLPTIEELSAWAAEFVEAHRAKPRRALGGLSANLYLEQHGPTRRVVDRDTCDIYLCPIVAERTCGRDGVQLDNIMYLPEPADLVQVQGKRVAIRRDPDTLDAVTLCDAADGRAVCRAYNERLFGTGRDVARIVRRRQSEYRRTVRKYLDGMDQRFETPTQQILRVRREHAQHLEQRLRAELGELPGRDATVLRPDLAASAKHCKQADARRIERHQRQRATGTADDRPRRSRGMEKLIARAEADAAAERESAGERRPTRAERFAALDRRYEQTEQPNPADMLGRYAELGDCDGDDARAPRGNDELDAEPTLALQFDDDDGPDQARVLGGINRADDAGGGRHAS